MPRDDYKYQPDTHLIATGELYLWTMMYTGRWKQRFSNYRKAFKQLEEAVGLADTRDLSRLQKQGLIQSFEYTHELAWLLMKDFFFYQGNPEIHGSRDASREAFKNGLIEDGEIWMDMIKIKNTDLLDLIDRVGRLFYEKE